MSIARPPYQRHGVSREEEKLWIGFYQRIHRDPVLASELLALMKADAVMRREHLALYLCCRESLRIAQQRQWRDQQIARVLRQVFIGPWRALRRLCRRSGTIAVQCLPESAQLPSPACALRSATSKRAHKSKPVTTRNGTARASDQA